MDQASPSWSGGTEAGLCSGVDWFRKLGYSPAEVEAAQGRLGLATDTNSLLGELLRSWGHQGPGDPPQTLAWTPGPHGTTPPPSPAPCQVEGTREMEDDLKPIIIDGSNVAMSHGSTEVFSCHGIQLAVDYFQVRGHAAITVFVPSWRKKQARPDSPITDQHILTVLEKRKIVVFTPSRRVGGKRMVCYDDRFIVKLAHESDGVIVSNDNYRDLQAERPEWRRCIEERLLMYSFVNDKFMPPDDPLGRHGPSLNNFLRKKPLPAEQKRALCPYNKKCTYGVKCKFYHPERANQSCSSLADELQEKARISGFQVDRHSRSSVREAQREPGPSPAPPPLPPDYDIENHTSVDEPSSTHLPQVGDNTLLCWDGTTTCQNHRAGSPAGGPHQADGPWPPCPSHHPRAGISQKYLDSGLGSDRCQHSHGRSHWARPRQNTRAGGTQHPSPVSGLERQYTERVCQCWSPLVPPTARGQHPSYSCLKSQSQPKYVYPPNMHYQYSPPHHNQYWSDPFPGLPQATTPCFLPGLILSPSPSPGGPCCTYVDPPPDPWARPQLGSSAFDPRRLDLRKKLQAIFNPRHVDTVMEMFPHLMDAQKVAAQILNLKAQGGVLD